MLGTLFHPEDGGDTYFGSICGLLLNCVKIVLFISRTLVLKDEALSKT
jgi:hypothetical protein